MPLVSESLKEHMAALGLKVTRSGRIPSALIPHFLADKLQSRGLFHDRTLSHERAGYWRVDPMPSEGELRDYYERTYWKLRGGSSETVGIRDLDHFELITDAQSSLLSGQGSVLNFGAGDGGASHLFHAVGNNVVNVEPSGLAAKHDGHRWKTLTTLEACTDSFDLIYGSHSLEHVASLNQVEKFCEDHLNPGGFVFWETPNALDPRNGGCNGRLFPPHTYYFTPEYFENLPYHTVHLATYDDAVPAKPCVGSGGRVIRYLGQHEPSANP